MTGKARLAGTDDLGLLADWYTAFVIELWGELPPAFDARADVERGIARSRSWLWLGPDNELRAMAVRHPAVSGVARVGPVYTPPEHRGRGFGSVVTAAATRDVLGDGAVPVLYTDLANPTSNKIYQALGFYAVTDRASVRFG